MNRMRSLFFAAAFYGWTAVMCFFMLWTLVLPRRWMLGVVHVWLDHTAWIERVIGGITYRVIGREHVPEGACIIAAKHQSAWETFKLHQLFGDPAIVLKKELLTIPLWGWYLRRSGMIPIDRGGGVNALAGMMQAAHRATEQGRKIVIFPQGTRVTVGAERTYKSGVAALYQELKIPVVPMALNSGLFWPKGLLPTRSGTITVEILPPIPAGLPRDVMMERLKNELEEASNRLAAGV